MRETGMGTDEVSESFSDRCYRMLTECQWNDENALVAFRAFVGAFAYMLQEEQIDSANPRKSQPGERAKYEIVSGKFPSGDLVVRVRFKKALSDLPDSEWSIAIDYPQDSPVVKESISSSLRSNSVSVATKCRGGRLGDRDQTYSWGYSPNAGGVRDACVTAWNMYVYSPGEPENE